MLTARFISMLILWLTVTLSSIGAVSAEPAITIDLDRTPLPRIPAGTQFGEPFADQPPGEWTHLISFVKGRLSRGDVEAVSETVAYYADLFNLVMLANVRRGADESYVLGEVAVGFSMKINGLNTVVTSETQKDLGGNLSFIGRGVLAGNVDALEEVERVARTPHSQLIDAPAVLLRDGVHREMIVRYFVWVFPSNGNLGTVAWLLDPAQPDRVVDEPLQLLPPNLIEDRELNVKADKFNMLGIPSKEAFALVRIPPGKPFAMTPQLKSIGGQATYDASSFKKLTAAVNETLRGE